MLWHFASASGSVPVRTLGRTVPGNVARAVEMHLVTDQSLFSGFRQNAVRWAIRLPSGSTATGASATRARQTGGTADFVGVRPEGGQRRVEVFQCRTRLCLVNHFRGRVSCPYGQNGPVTRPSARKAPRSPARTRKRSAKGLDGRVRRQGQAVKVPTQCVDRSADKAVYCSCRCADINGDKPSDQTFCDCRTASSATVSSPPLAVACRENLTGSYCIRRAPRTARPRRARGRLQPRTSTPCARPVTRREGSLHAGWS